GIRPVLVVTGPEHDALARALAGLGVQLAVNPKPESGQGSSVGVGVSALPAAVIPALIEALKQPGKAIAAPRYADGLGNPVLFASSVFQELLALGGDRGARSVIERDPS